MLDERHAGVPILADLIEVVVDAPDALREIAFDRGDLDRYHDATDPLVKSLAPPGPDRTSEATPNAAAAAVQFGPSAS